MVLLDVVPEPGTFSGLLGGASLLCPAAAGVALAASVACDAVAAGVALAASNAFDAVATGVALAASNAFDAVATGVV